MAAVSSHEIEYGVLFSDAVVGDTPLESAEMPFASGTIGSTAMRHGAELAAAGFTVPQVVHDYGDICQAITEVAVEQRQASDAPRTSCRVDPARP